MTVTSKRNFKKYIVKCIIAFFLSFVTFAFIYYGFCNETFTTTNIFIGVLLSILHFYMLVIPDSATINQIIVEKEGIDVKYFRDSKIYFISYEDIIDIEKNYKYSTIYPVGRISDGYYGINILLTNNRTLSFDGLEFENYDELKRSIYNNWINFKEIGDATNT